MVGPLNELKTGREIGTEDAEWRKGEEITRSDLKNCTGLRNAQIEMFSRPLYISVAFKVLKTDKIT